MAAPDLDFWTSLETDFIRIACTSEAKTMVRKSAQCELFIADKNIHGFWSRAKGTLPLSRKIISGTYLTVGTVNGSKVSTSFMLIGTQTRPVDIKL